MSKYKIIALIGEAGSGKDFLLRCSRIQYPNYHEIISFTTRPLRQGEKDGVNYHFVSTTEFNEMINQGLMLETASFNGWLYGTSKSDLREDQINIGVFNPTGIRSLLAYKDEIDLKVFYVRAPAHTRLIRQLQREDEPNVDEIIRRYHTDQEDFRLLEFEHFIINNETKQDIDEALKLMVWSE